MLLTFLAAQTLTLPAEAAPPPLASEEIVVAAERMRRVRVRTKTDRKTGEQRCVFKRRSGDAAFDAMMCRALLKCAKEVTTRPQMEACLAPVMDDYAKTLRAKRLQSGGG